MQVITSVGHSGQRLAPQQAPAHDIVIMQQSHLLVSLGQILQARIDFFDALCSRTAGLKQPGA